MEITVQHKIDGFSAAELFKVAVDIEAYPEFLPYCVAARILEDSGEEWLVDNVFGIGPVRQRFQTRARMDEPKGIVISSHEPPFKELNITWAFEEDPAGGCLVTYSMKQEFLSALTNKLAEPMAVKLEKDLIKNFERRARKVYGKP